MKPEEYNGKEWHDLLSQMNGKQIKKSLRGAVRAEARKAQKIAQTQLNASKLKVKGNLADWKKGIRTRVYPGSKGLGFMITVKARAGRGGSGEKSMHTNRYGIKKPVLMWAEDGTDRRKTNGRTRWFIRQKRGHSTGRMGAYRFLERATPDMFNTVENNLAPEVEKAVTKVAAKCGFI